MVQLHLRLCENQCKNMNHQRAAGAFQRQSVISKTSIQIVRTLKATETRQVKSQSPCPLQLITVALLPVILAFQLVWG